MSLAIRDLPGGGTTPARRPGATRPPRHAGRLVWPWVAALALAVSSCGGHGAEVATNAAAGDPAAAGSPRSGEIAATAAAPLTPVDPASLDARARGPGARATLVNVWATWCGPCREEFPDLQRLAREYSPRGLRLMLVSADLDSAEARRFLAARGVEFETYFQVGDDMTFINQMNPKWTGALPATFVYDSTGRRVDFWEGRADYAQFERSALAAMVGRGAAPQPGGNTP